jgi:hypothetical protein
MSENRKKLQATHNLITSYSMKIVLITTIIIAIWKREWIWVIGCVIGIIITLSPSLIKRNIKITLPWSIELLIATVAALNMIGVLLNAYLTIPGFPQFVDFLTSTLVAFLAFALIYIIDEYWDGLNMDKYAMAFVVVTTTMASCVVLEFIKWFKIFGAKQSSVEDVLISLLIGTIGGIVTAFIGVNLIKKGKFDSITQDFGKQIDTTIIERIK